MKNKQKITEKNSVILVSETDKDTCENVCYHPECACRFRVIAGCSLPLAPVQIINKKQIFVKGEIGDKQQ